MQISRIWTISHAYLTPDLTHISRITQVSNLFLKITMNWKKIILKLLKFSVKQFNYYGFELNYFKTFEKTPLYYIYFYFIVNAFLHILIYGGGRRKYL